MPGLLVFLLAATTTCTPLRPYAAPPTPLGSLESDFLRARSLADQIDVARSQGKPTAALEPWYREARTKFLAGLARTDSAPLSPEDRRALRTMRSVAVTSLGENPAPAVGERPSQQIDCAYDAAALLASGDEEPLGDRIMACYGLAASSIPWDGKVIDRLTVFAMLGETADAATRQRLWLTLDPVWRSVNGDGGPSSPWRTLLARRAERWKATGQPHEERARALGVDPDSVAVWLERVLEAWRRAQPDTVIEPWDWYHFTGSTDRRLSPRVSHESLLPTTRKWFKALGADPDELRIQFDIDPRAGKYPVAYTTFGDRPHVSDKGWWPGAPAVFATYRVGGLGNLVELLHETGHGIHIAGIRTRPAFADWPDSDTFTEAVADLPSLDAYEPLWQMRTLGDSVPLAESLRAKYSGVILDMVWALFEIRMFASPGQDPNAVWTGITSRYLRIRPHPERSWWAMRGQLVDGPGYMLNYALGALLTAQLRARIRELRGPWTEGDAGWYPWVRETLFRYGQERPTREVVMDFLGGPVGPEAVLDDLHRALGR
jgi:hypothetical protein